MVMDSWGKYNIELDFSSLSGKKIKSGTYSAHLWAWNC